MLTDQDIAKLAGVLATQEDIKELKSDVSGIKEDVAVLKTSVDNLTKVVKDIRDEQVVLHHRVETLEKTR